MSFTILAFIAFAVFVAGAVGTGVAADVFGNKQSYGYSEEKPKRSIKPYVFGGLSFLLAGLAVASFFAAIGSYSENERASQEACVSAGGFVYELKCVDKVPHEIMKL